MTEKERATKGLLRRSITLVTGIYIVIMLLARSGGIVEGAECSGDDIRYLFEFARDIIDARFSKQHASTLIRYENGEEWLSSRDLPREVVVRLWRNGRDISSACTEGATVFEAVRKASEELVGLLKKREDSDRWIEEGRLSLYLISARTPLPNATISVLQDRFEPGIHGFTIEHGNDTVTHLNSFAVVHNLSLEKIIERVCLRKWGRSFRWNTSQITFSLLTISHFIESSPRGEPVRLMRDLTHLNPSDLTMEGMRTAVNSAVGWYGEIQKREGLFWYQYLPSLRRYIADDNMVRQAGACYGLAQAARIFGDEKARACATKAIDCLLESIEYLDRAENKAFIKTEDQGKLGVTALTLLAMSELALEDRYAPYMEKMANAILSLQKTNGSMATYFLNRRRQGSSDYYPGEAMLAIIRLYRLNHDERYIAFLKRAFPYYSAYWRSNKNTAFVPWQSSAMSGLYQVTGDRQYADFVFEMNDWIIEYQLDESTAPYPDYVGGYSKGGGEPGNSSASYTEGMVDAYYLAKVLGDTEREGRYRKSLRDAAAFLLNLQYDDIDTFYLPRSQTNKVVGAFKQSPSGSAVRIDYTQHAITALARIYEVLGGKWE
ncbi:MAG: hypothetical protein JW844_05415 [Candidatus Omnitrophica bacterium]|nr:hypothetical protein [Candidatus Omnitrophota bacterium]